MKRNCPKTVTSGALNRDSHQQASASPGTVGHVSAIPTTVDPTELGFDPDKIAALVQRAHREVDSRLLPSCQLALARNGQLALFETIGEAEPGSRYHVFSATKAFVAGAMWQLIGQGRIDVHDRVADVFEEFTGAGKEDITIEQVMLHTSGFPHAPMTIDAAGDRQKRIERMASWRLNWEPGTRYEYHPTSAHWVLGELIERVTGLSCPDYIDQNITTPLGLPRVLGLDPSDDQRITRLQVCGDPPSAAELQELFGISDLEAMVGEVTDDALLSLDDPHARQVGVPGGGGVMTAADLARYYQALLRDGKGLWDPDVLADATSHVRNTLPDPLLNVPANRSLGLILAGDDGLATRRGFGATNSPGTFGHNGAKGQLAWADPATGISFAYCTNGMDRDPIREARRGVGLSSRAATTLAA